MRNRVQIEEVIKDIQTASDIGSLTEYIIAYDKCLKTSKCASLYQFGISPDKISALPAAMSGANPDNRENAILKLAETYIKDISTDETYKEYKARIESDLKLLIGLYKNKETNKNKKNSREKLLPQTFILIARAYLLRSRIIRPKGITVPEKKKEALKKGVSFVDKAIEQLQSAVSAPSPDNGLLEDAWRVKGQLCLELNYIGAKEYCDRPFLALILKQAMENGCTKFCARSEDTKIAIRYSEIERWDKQYLQEIIKPSAKGRDLEKAKAYYLLDGKSNGSSIKCHINGTIEYLRTRPFSDQLWEETVSFILKLREEKYGLWKKFALDAYESCLIQERKTSAIRLRWHWSRHRDLYDMAFLAVLGDEDKPDGEKYKEMAKICDSHKSRSSLHLASLEAVAKSNEELGQMLKAYEKALTGEHIKDFETVQKTIDKHETPPPEGPRITEAPSGWIVVHFYLNRLDDKGYALIYNADEKTWKMGKFPRQKLFDDFLTWQTNYNRSKELSAGHLMQLCKEIGNAMPFLFKKDVIPTDKNVLFIPHDFLHQLPLHGAIKVDEKSKAVSKIFLENHPCCYLPAWSFASKVTDSGGDEHVLLNNFPIAKDGGYDFKGLLSIKNWAPSSKMNNASPKNLKDIRSAPELLVILCHGKADAANPFNSRLELANGGITHLEILETVKGVEGSRVVLGACETDLAPPLGDILDEHLSIATAFLQKGAAEILGTMWEVNAENTVEKTIKQIIENVKKKPMYKIINNWQIEKLELWKKKDFGEHILRVFT